MTYTYALLDVSAETYGEIRRLLEEAGYQHAFDPQEDGRVAIDMHGVALVPEWQDGPKRHARPVLKLKELEEREIRNAVAVTGGGVSEAARLLGIPRSTLYRRLREMGVKISGAGATRRAIGDAREQEEPSAACTCRFVGPLVEGVWLEEVDDECPKHGEPK